MKEKRIRLFDWCIIAVIAAGLLFTALRFFSAPGQKALEEGQAVLITLICDDIRAEVLDGIQPGDAVIERQNKVEMGTVSEVQTAPSIVYTFTGEGEMMRSTREGYRSITLSVEGHCRINEAGVPVFGNTSYYIGQSLSFAVGAKTVNMLILSVEPAAAS